MTDQTHNFPPAGTLDEIRALLGSIPEDEYEQRRRLKLCRTIASHQVTTTRSPMARALYWMVADTVTANLFAAHPLAVLEELAKFCRRLLICAGQAETLEPGDDDL